MKMNIISASFMRLVLLRCSFYLSLIIYFSVAAQIPCKNHHRSYIIPVSLIFYLDAGVYQ